MSTSPDLGLPYIASSQAQPEVTHNEALNLLQALLNGATDRGINTPPGSPTSGDIYIVGTAPTGAWAGRANTVTIWTGTAWDFIPGETSAGTPITMGARQEGIRVWVKDENLKYVWNGSSWVSSTFSGGTLTTSLNEAPIVTIASSATVNIGAAAANTISISGTTTITAFDSIANGALRRLHFQGALTLTHNATSLILPTGASITTAAGDMAEFVSLGSGNWRCTGYERASGNSVNSQTGTFTPTLTFATPGDLSVAYSTQTGDFTRIGDRVFVNFSIVTSTFTHTTASGNAQIMGFPITIGVQSMGDINFQGITKASYTNFCTRMTVSTTLATIAASGSGVAGASVTSADMPSGGTVILQGSAIYRI